MVTKRKAKPTRTRPPITISPDPGLWALVRERATKEDRTVTAIVERALRRYLIEPLEKGPSHD